MTEPELKSLCSEWQERLRLRDWKVVARIKRVASFDVSNMQGECSWTLENKTAFIKILDTIDYSDDCVFPQDQEKTLVHELLHLHFAEWTNESKDCRTPVHGEQGIDCIAEALIKLKRQAENTENREGDLALQGVMTLAGMTN
jgi:hypothetical protein